MWRDPTSRYHRNGFMKLDLKVFYDGSCPLCSAEIAHYQKHDMKHEIEFVDVSLQHCALPANLSRDRALARFHVQRNDGTLASGAEAFVLLWERLPRWRWAAGLARLPGLMKVMEGAYQIALRIRPRISRWLRSRQERRSRSRP